jgi:hypothetical protein
MEEGGYAALLCFAVLCVHPSWNYGVWASKREKRRELGQTALLDELGLPRSRANVFTIRSETVKPVPDCFFLRAGAVLGPRLGSLDGLIGGSGCVVVMDGCSTDHGGTEKRIDRKVRVELNGLD